MRLIGVEGNRIAVVMTDLDGVERVEIEGIELLAGQLAGRLHFAVVGMKGAATILHRRRENLAAIGQQNLRRVTIDLRKHDILHTACEQPHLVEARDALIEGILHDLAAIEGGAALPALGEGVACDFCDARGLCRKDFWV